MYWGHLFTITKDPMNTCCVLISTPESQQPKPGCEWYQPTTISGLKKGYSLLLLRCSYYLMHIKVVHAVTLLHITIVNTWQDTGMEMDSRHMT